VEEREVADRDDPGPHRDAVFEEVCEEAEELPDGRAIRFFAWVAPGEGG
jgi:hypothetical protein